MKTHHCPWRWYCGRGSEGQEHPDFSDPSDLFWNLFWILREVDAAKTAVKSKKSEDPFIFELFQVFWAWMRNKRFWAIIYRTRFCSMAFCGALIQQLWWNYNLYLLSTTYLVLFNFCLLFLLQGNRFSDAGSYFSNFVNFAMHAAIKTKIKNTQSFNCKKNLPVYYLYNLM